MAVFSCFFPALRDSFGVAFLRQSGLTMAFVGFVITVVLAVFQFGTPVEVALGASTVGFLKSFGISVSVADTMLIAHALLGLMILILRCLAGIMLRLRCAILDVKSR